MLEAVLLQACGLELYPLCFHSVLRDNVVCVIVYIFFEREIL